MNAWRSLPFSALLAALPAQVDTITESRLAELVGWLAADERAGRDTPSPQLDAAAEWLGKQFAEAGLQQVVKDSWFHEYTLPGQRIDPTGLVVKLVRTYRQDKREFELKPGTDVRLWRPGDVPSGADEPTTVAQSGDPVLQQLLRAQSGRRPLVVEVDPANPQWQAAAGERLVLGGRRGASRPVFYVRPGLLPAFEPNQPEETAWTMTWQAPVAESLDVGLRNVVALLPGTDKKDEYVIVSAHYDHIGIGMPVGGDGIYNGADDDASGTAAVVALARALAKTPCRRSVLFVCFSAEEKGLRGSAAFAEHPPVPREQIVANLNLEMLGRPEEGKAGKAWITGNDLSDFAAILTAALARSGVEVIDFPMAGQLFAQSDNYSFVKHGIVAHSLSAGSLHQDYHRPSDEVGKLDIPHMTKVVRGLYAAVRELADRDAPPAWNEKGEARLKRLRR